jgi:Pentapeptide repeats (8 copies)
LIHDPKDIWTLLPVRQFLTIYVSWTPSLIAVFIIHHYKQIVPFLHEILLSLSIQNNFTTKWATYEAQMIGTHLNGANLFGANLHLAKLNEADLTSANLSDADLTGAILKGADLTAANLREAKLYGASLDRADLRSANLMFAEVTTEQLAKAFWDG